MSFLDEIRKQPKETRETMFFLSVFITSLLVGAIWFQSFQKNLYVLMNPGEDVEKALAVGNASTPSLFGFIWQTAGDVRGLVSGFLSDEDNSADVRIDKKDGSDKIYTLPLAEPRSR